jgi:hypothetical protein
MKSLTIGLLTAAVLLGSAGGAAAKTNTLKAPATGPEGQEVGSVTVKAKVKRGVVRSVSGIKVRNVFSSCVGEGEPFEGDRISANLKGSVKVKKNSQGVYRFSKKMKGGGHTWRIAGVLNKPGTRLSGGSLKSADVGGGDSATCSVETTFNMVE